MGKRLLYITPELLVEFLKDSPETPKMLKIERGLPPDATYKGYEWTEDGRTLALVVESEGWIGDSREALPPPQLTIFVEGVEFQEGVAHAL